MKWQVPAARSRIELVMLSEGELPLVEAQRVETSPLSLLRLSFDLAPRRRRGRTPAQIPAISESYFPSPSSAACGQPLTHAMEEICK